MCLAGSTKKLTRRSSTFRWSRNSSGLADAAERDVEQTRLVHVLRSRRQASVMVTLRPTAFRCAGAGHSPLATMVPASPPPTMRILLRHCFLLLRVASRSARRCEAPFLFRFSHDDAPIAVVLGHADQFVMHFVDPFRDVARPSLCRSTSTSISSPIWTSFNAAISSISGPGQKAPRASIVCFVAHPDHSPSQGDELAGLGIGQKFGEAGAPSNSPSTSALNLPALDSRAPSSRPTS